MSETGLHVTGVASREWGYNTRGELVSEDGPWTSFDRGYRYDGIGNRLRTAVNTTHTTTATGANLGTYFASSGGAAGANPVNQYGQVALPVECSPKTVPSVMRVPARERYRLP
jgi:hypothetical protein